MDELFKWIALNGNNITISGLLMTEFAIAMVGLHKEWIVLGTTHKKCMEERDEFKKNATDIGQQEAREDKDEIVRLRTELKDKT